MSPQDVLFGPLPPVAGTKRSRDGWEFELTDREVMLLRKPITPTSGGWQGAMREAATRIHSGRVWKVSFDLMRRLFRMCVKHGRHGGYQQRLPMRVLTPVFSAYQDEFRGTWFYGRYERGDYSRIKLGSTDDPPARHRPATDNPRELETAFCIWDPSGGYEDVVKRRFESARIKRSDGRRSEWFMMTTEVDAFCSFCARVSSNNNATVNDLPSYL